MKPKTDFRSRSLRVLACLLLPAALVLLVAGRPSVQAQTLWQLAFVFLGNIDATHLDEYEEVTTDWEEYIQPAVSPNGLTIAYVHAFSSSGVRFENREIVRINADGSGLMRLTNNDLAESWPTWSPDGTRLAFAAGDLYVMPVTAVGGGAPVQLTTGTLYPENLVWSPDGTRLAFNSRPTCAEAPECEYAAELYVVTVAGGQLTRLTDNDQYDGNPTWSPNGEQLAYETRPVADGDRHLYRIAAAGGPATPLVTSGDNFDPAWSPDGTRIAYVSGRQIKTVQPDGAAQLAVYDEGWDVFDPLWTTDGRQLTFLELQYVICGHGLCEEERLLRLELDSGHADLLSEPYNRPLDWSATDDLIAYTPWTRTLLYARDLPASDSSPARRLTFPSPINTDPTWSPDGGRLAFSSRRDFDYNIHISNADGTERRALTTHPANDWNPSWSSDEAIAFTTNRDGNWELYQMDEEGGGQTNLTRTPAMAENDAAWSPSGAQLAFARQENGNWDIYVMTVGDSPDADGSGVTRLTTHAGNDRNPTWSPNGARIAFETDRDGNDEIYILTVAGPPGNEVNWTRDPADQREPAWSPDGSEIAFTSVIYPGSWETASLVTRQVAGGAADQIVVYDLQTPLQPAWRPVVYDLPPRVWVPVVGR